MLVVTAAVIRHFSRIFTSCLRRCFWIHVFFLTNFLLQVEGAKQFAVHSELSHPHDCCECELHFASAERLRHHTAIVHRIGQPLAAGGRCVRCHLELAGVAAFLDHAELAHRNSCEACPRTFPDLLSLKHHVELDHPEPLVSVFVKDFILSLNGTYHSGPFQGHRILTRP